MEGGNGCYVFCNYLQIAFVACSGLDAKYLYKAIKAKFFPPFGKTKRIISLSPIFFLPLYGLRLTQPCVQICAEERRPKIRHVQIHLAAKRHPRVDLVSENVLLENVSPIFENGKHTHASKLISHLCLSDRLFRASSAFVAQFLEERTKKIVPLLVSMYV